METMNRRFIELIRDPDPKRGDPCFQR